MRWQVMQSWMAGAPEFFEAPSTDDLRAQVQTFADSKKVRRDRPAIGPLRMEEYTDQVDFMFERGGKSRKFMVLMVAD